MTTSLAEGGVGLGTCGLPPKVMRVMGNRPGFSSVTKLDLENPFNNRYVLRP